MYANLTIATAFIMAVIGDSLHTSALAILAIIIGWFAHKANQELKNPKLPETDQPIADQCAKDLGMNRFWAGE